MEQQKTKKKKIYTYPITATWMENGAKSSYVSQLYQTGIYIIFNNDPAAQGCMSPSGMVRLVKKLKKSEEENKISNLIFSDTISVSDEAGFWEKVRSKEEISVSNEAEKLLKVRNTINVTDKYRNISYQWTIKEIDEQSNSIVFTSTPKLTGLESQVKTEDMNNTCPLNLFRGTIESQLLMGYCKA